MVDETEFDIMYAEEASMLDDIAKLQEGIDKAIELLDAAFCPYCDKSGAYYGSMGEVFQCQWCDEVEALKHKG